MKHWILALTLSLILLAGAGNAANGYNNFDCWNGGANALVNTTTGNLNVGCGAQSLQAVTTGNFNVGFGSKSGVAMSTGSGNVFVGYLAGNNATTGSNNVVIGPNVVVESAAGSNQLAIGASATVNAITGNMVAGGVLQMLGNTRVATDVSSTSTTLAAVTGLTATLEASKTYTFRAVLFFDADAVGGHKYAMGGTATATSIIYHTTSLCDASGLNVISERETALGSTASQAGCVAGKTIIEGTITTSAAGTILPQFAQLAAGGTSAVKAGSIFHVERLP